MRSILIRLTTADLGLLATAQAPQAFATQTQSPQINSRLPEQRKLVDGEGPALPPIPKIDSDLPEERTVVDGEGTVPAAAPQQAPAAPIDPGATYRLTSDYLT